MRSLIKEKLAQDEVVRVFGVGQLMGHKLIEMVGLSGGYDAIWIDQEHTGCSVADIEVATLACRASGLDSFVRLAPTDYATLMRPLEAGAGGVMCAQIKTAEDALQLMQWVKFWPQGNRGLTGAGIDGSHGMIPQSEYAEMANLNTFFAIQIETLDAVENIDEIAAIKGIDLLFVGPADLAQSLGLTGQFEHPRCYETIDHIAVACQKAGKPWGIIGRNDAYASRWVERGCRMVVAGNDIAVALAGIKGTKAAFPSFFNQ